MNLPTIESALHPNLLNELTLSRNSDGGFTAIIEVLGKGGRVSSIMEWRKASGSTINEALASLEADLAVSQTKESKA